MGSRVEFGEMIQFVSEHQLRPIVDSMYALSDIAQAMNRMKLGTHFGHVALQVN
ncbi:zinc-binding dehydrogenase [Alkalihalobacillus sp. TS-13]|uniref:zinc-binding dehydrogenase n=1 Tax=Alkalihalobacillus sp. TS-13 TaxID=2842455 RepID=UPI001C887885